VTYTGPRKGYPKTVTGIRRFRWEQAFREWLLAGCPEQPTLMPAKPSPQLRKTERLVLTFLAMFADFDTGNSAHPSHRTLAILADLSVEENPKGGRPAGVKRVARVLVDAERLGWIECVDSKAYRGKAKGYRLAVPWWWVQVLTEEGLWFPDEKGVPDAVPHSGERGTSSDPKGVPPAVPPPSITEDGGSARPARRSLPPADDPVSVQETLRVASDEDRQAWLAAAREGLNATAAQRREADAATRRQREEEARAKAEALKQLYPDQFAEAVNA